MTTHTVYVDGACPNYGKPNANAGWGAYLINPQGDTLVLAGPVPTAQLQTNGRAELLPPANSTSSVQARDHYHHRFRQPARH